MANIQNIMVCRVNMATKRRFTKKKDGRDNVAHKKLEKLFIFSSKRKQEKKYWIDLFENIVCAFDAEPKADKISLEA